MQEHLKGDVLHAMIHICSCSERPSSAIRFSRNRKSLKPCKHCSGSAVGLQSSSESTLTGLGLSMAVDPHLNWKTTSNCKKRAVRRARTSFSGLNNVIITKKESAGFANKGKKRMEDMPVYESEKLGVSILGRRFSDSPEVGRFSDSPEVGRFKDSLGGEAHGSQETKYGIGLMFDREGTDSNEHINMEEINENLYDNVDFSGMSILATAACNCLDLELSLHKVGSSKVDLSDGPTNAESHAVATMMDQDVTIVQNLACKDENGSTEGLYGHVSDKSVRDDKLASSKENPKERRRTESSLCRDHFKWDLNTPLDDWDNDCGEAITASHPHALHIGPGTNYERLDFVESCNDKLVFEDNDDSRVFEVVNTGFSTSYAISNHLESSGVSAVPCYHDENKFSHIRHIDASSIHADGKLLRDSLTNVSNVAKKPDLSGPDGNCSFLSRANPDDGNMSENQLREYLDTHNVDGHSCQRSRNGDDGTSSEIGQGGPLGRSSLECTKKSGADSDSLLSDHHILKYEDLPNQGVYLSPRNADGELPRDSLTNVPSDSKKIDPNGSHDNNVSSSAANPGNGNMSKNQLLECYNAHGADRHSNESSRNGDHGVSSEIGHTGLLDRSSVECTEKFGAATGFLVSDHHALTSEELTNNSVNLSSSNLDGELLIESMMNVSINAKKFDPNGSQDTSISLATVNPEDGNVSRNQLQEYCNAHNTDGHSCEPSRNKADDSLSNEAGQSGPSGRSSVEHTEKLGATTGSLLSDHHALKSEDLIDVCVADEVCPMSTVDMFDVSSKTNDIAIGPFISNSCADISHSDQHVTVPEKKDDAECKSGSHPLFRSHVDVNPPICMDRVELEEDDYQYEDGECCESLTYKWEDEVKTEYVDNDSGNKEVAAIATAFDLHSISMNPNNLECKNQSQMVTDSIYGDEKRLFQNVTKEFVSHTHSILKTPCAKHGPDTFFEAMKSDNHASMDHGRHGGANGTQKLHDNRKGDAESGVNEMDSHHLANLRMKSSGWDQHLPDSYRRSLERSAESLGRDARTPGRRVLSSQRERSNSPVMSCRNDRSYARASRLHEYKGLYSEDERNDHISGSLGRDGNTTLHRRRIKSDKWSDFSCTLHPTHHCSPGHRVRDCFPESGSTNAVAATLAKLESSGFVVAPDGTIIKASMSRRSENVCSRNIHLSAEQVSPVRKRDYVVTQSYQNPRQLSPDRNLDHGQCRNGGYGSRMAAHGHREQHRRTSRGASRRDRSFSPQLRARSRSRSRSRSPYSWVSTRERNNGRMNGGASLHQHNRSPLDFRTESRLERTRLAHQQPGFRERMERYSPPPRNHTSPPLRWVEERNKMYARSSLRSPIPQNSSRNHHFVPANGQRRKETDEYYYPTHSARSTDARCSRNDRSDDSRRGRAYSCKMINLLEQYDSSGDTKRLSYDEEDSRACNTESKISAGHEERSPRCTVNHESKFGDLPRTDRVGEVHSKCAKADNSPMHIESHLPRIDGEGEFHFMCEGDKKSSGCVYNYKTTNPVLQYDAPAHTKHYQEVGFGTCNGRPKSSSELEQRSPRGLDHVESQPGVRPQIDG